MQTSILIYSISSHSFTNINRVKYQINITENGLGIFA